jgi:TolA-binding protein
MRKYFFSLILALFAFHSTWGVSFAQSPATDREATPVVTGPAAGDALYQQALDTYLTGDYDQAILLAAKAVQADPQNQKAQNLLTLLTNEKKDIGKYEIWLSSGQDKTAPAPSASAPDASDAKGFQEQIQKVQRHFDNFYVAQTRENGQFQGQIQAVSELLRENSDHQYDELRKSQTDLIQSVQAISESHDRNLWILYLLCLISIGLSSAAVWALLRRDNRRV